MKIKKLLPGNVKHSMKVELPSLMALSLIESEHLTVFNLAEIEAVAMVWDEIGYDDIAEGVLEVIRNMTKRIEDVGKHIPILSEVHILLRDVPIIIHSLARAPNHIMDAACKKVHAGLIKG